jgi:hypothetical protein
MAIASEVEHTSTNHLPKRQDQSGVLHDDDGSTVADADDDVKNNARPLPQRNLGLPDIDDTSMIHVLTYVDFYQQDLAWSVLSDSFFLIGGILYITISLWDILGTKNTDKNHAYNVICALAPFVYVLNSLVDIQWASHMQQRHRIRRQMTKQWSESLVEFFSPFSITETKQNDQESLFFGRLRRHAAHRRSLWAALSFGVAALLGFLSVLYSDNYEMNSASNHVYIVSAIIALSGKRNRPWLEVSALNIGNNDQYSSAVSAFLVSPGALEDVGDLMFLVGSIVDSVLVDFNFDQDSLSLFSAILWFIDACFYLQADYVMFLHAKEVTLQRKDQVLV